MFQNETLKKKLAELEESLANHKAALEYTETETGKKAAERLIATLEREIELVKKRLRSQL